MISKHVLAPGCEPLKEPEEPAILEASDPDLEEASLDHETMDPEDSEDERRLRILSRWLRSSWG